MLNDLSRVISTSVIHYDDLDVVTVLRDYRFHTAAEVSGVVVIRYDYRNSYVIFFGINFKYAFAFADKILVREIA